MTAAPTLREWLREAPFSLAMSSGFFGFFAHAGFVSVLEEEGLLPERGSGSSAGALVTGLWAAGLDGQRMRDELLKLRREHFWDPRPGAGLLAGKLFHAKLHALIGDAKLEGGRFPLAISLWQVRTRRTHVVTTGEAARALVASCAVPVLFHPVHIDGKAYLDGGVLDRPGLAGMPDAARVLHHHLASRSPWRTRGGVSMQIPRRNKLVSVVLDGLPRLGPFRLGEAGRALDGGARGLRRAMGQPITDGIVRVGVD